MDTHHGVPLYLWTKAKEEIRNVLIDVARRQSLITYLSLTNHVTTVALEPDSHALHEMLGEISIEENAGTRGLLSVVVVHKQGDKKPGPGFFKLAKQLGRDTSDTDMCWVKELQHVYQVHHRGLQ